MLRRLKKYIIEIEFVPANQLLIANIFSRSQTATDIFDSELVRNRNGNGQREKYGNLGGRGDSFFWRIFRRGLFSFLKKSIYKIMNLKFYSWCILMFILSFFSFYVQCST